MMFMVVLPTLDSNLEMGNHSEKKNTSSYLGVPGYQIQGFPNHEESIKFHARKSGDLALPSGYD